MTRISSTSEPTSQTKRWGRTLLAASSCLTLGFTLAARLGAFHWSFDLLALFHTFYFFAALGLVVISLLMRRYTWASVACLALFINGWLLFPYLPVAASANEARDLRIYVHNLYYLNDDLDTVLEDIALHNPDVVFLMEYSDEIQGQLEPRLERYPHRLIEPSRFTMGVALFSRVPLIDAQIRRFEATRIPIVQARLELGTQSVSFVGGHPWPPLGRWGALHRAQMTDIARVATDTPHPLVVAGDFNASPWSFVVDDLRQSAGVRDAQRGFGVRNTWWLNRFVALPIDQILVSSEWTVLDLTQGNRGGSDHAPLIIDLKLGP